MAKSSAQRSAEYHARRLETDPKEYRKKRAAQKRELRRKATVTKMLLQAQADERKDTFEYSLAMQQRTFAHREKTHELFSPLALDQALKALRTEKNAVQKPKEAEHHVEEATTKEDSSDEEDEESVVGNETWMPNSGMPIIFPLTESRRKVYVNLDEDACLSTTASKLVHEAFETSLDNLQKVDGLGQVFHQVKDDLPRSIRKDLHYIFDKRNELMHEKWGCRLKDPERYEDTMLRLLRVVCPNWKIIHYNHVAENLKRIVADRDAEIADLKRRLYGTRGKRDRMEYMGESDGETEESDDEEYGHRPRKRPHVVSSPSHLK